MAANPVEGEHYYLRVLLNHVAGATSFESLTTVYGRVLSTFCEVTERRGLIEEDNTLDESLAETTGWMMPYAL
jgi:hypothetical protein